LVFWPIVTVFLLTSSPTLFAQTNDNASARCGRVVELNTISRPGVFGAVYNFIDSRDPNVGPLPPIFRPELGRMFRVGMRFA
jgi:hypothetical protein